MEFFIQSFIDVMTFCCRVTACAAVLEIFPDAELFPDGLWKSPGPMWVKLRLPAIFQKTPQPDWVAVFQKSPQPDQVGAEISFDNVTSRSTI